MTFDNMVLQLVHELNGSGIILYVLITTFASVLLSFCIGLERQIRGKTGSLKIHLLLAAGCSLLMSLSLWGIRVADGTIDLVNGVLDNVPKTSYDTSRVAASILKQRDQWYPQRSFLFTFKHFLVFFKTLISLVR